MVVNRSQTTHGRGGSYSNLAMTSARPAQEQFRRTCADSLLYFSGVSNTNESTGCIQVCDDCASITRPGCATFVGDPSKLHLSSILLLNTFTPTHRKRSSKPVFDYMAHDRAAAPSIIESETWDICTPSASSENITKNALSIEMPQSSSIPWPGRTFIIQSHKTGQVITFLDGEVVMDKPGGLGTFKWRCVEEKGWMGFKDPASAQYLGYHEHGLLFCRSPHHRNNEYLCPRMRPEGGCVLLVRHDDHLRPLGVFANESEDGIGRKVKIMDWSSEEIVWDFIEVQNQQ